MILLIGRPDEITNILPALQNFSRMEREYSVTFFSEVNRVPSRSVKRIFGDVFEIAPEPEVLLAAARIGDRISSGIKR